MNLLSKKEYLALSPEERAQYFEGIRSGDTDGDGVIDTNPGRTVSGGVPAVVNHGVNLAYGYTPLSQVPIVGPAGGAALSTAMQGGSGKQIATQAGRAGARSGVNQMISEAFPNLPMVGNIGLSYVDEFFNPVSNYKAATMRGVSTGLGQTIGNMVLPGIGGYVGGSLASFLSNNSLRDGWMGDAADSRSHEQVRDNIEDRGYSRGDTKKAAREYEDMLAKERQSEVNQPQSRKAQSLRDFYDRMNLSDDSWADGPENNVGGSRGSSTGTGGGYNDGEGGVTGL